MGICHPVTEERRVCHLIACHSSSKFGDSIYGSLCPSKLQRCLSAASVMTTIHRDRKWPHPARTTVNALHNLSLHRNSHPTSMPAARSTLACIPCRSARHKCAGNPPRFPDHDGPPSQNPVRLAEQSCIRCERMSKECWWMPSGRTGKRCADQEVRDKQKGPSESPLPHSIPTATKTLLDTSTTSPGATLAWHTLPYCSSISRQHRLALARRMTSGRQMTTQSGTCR